MNPLIKALIDLGEFPAPAATLAGLQALIDARAGNLVALTPSDDDILQRKAGAWANRTLAEVRADLLVTKLYCRLASNYTLTSTTAAQKLFNTTTNGELTLPAGRYVYRLIAYLTSMSATSGNAAWNLLGAGTATLADHIYSTAGGDASALGVGGKSGGVGVFGVSEPASIFTATTGTGMAGDVKGSFSLSVGGTIIPSIALVTAAAAVAQAGTIIVIEQLNADGANYGGAWT